MKWHTCESCEEEFRVITDNITEVSFCPLCGHDLPIDEEPEEDYDYD